MATLHADRVPGSPRLRQGESPRFDTRTQELYWVDAATGRLLTGRLGPTGLQPGLTVDLPRIGCAAALADHRLGWVVAGADCLWWVRRDGSTRLLIDGITPDQTRFLADGTVAADGSLWVGSQTSPRRPAGALHRITPQLRVETVLEGVTVSNGIAFHGETMYYVDTLPHRRLERFRVHGGRLHDRTTVCGITDGSPDGIAVDDEGAVWVAVWGAGQVRRHDPDGRLLDTVLVPARLPSAVALCGHELVITTARHDSAEDDAGGYLHAVTVPVPGPGALPFAADPRGLTTR
ncbi:hypothetical protein EII34_09130 [Arachnia propionica]|uniref:SMP-30/Gluconolactonase/LRE-like region domain-containing protein n=1 Tax=Arachnia propionica TaxID=1750 RepID=A0A3P1T5A8_9ACTN|nr:SMP-30/gluconolactonase/LRE family protein [Arachnia propionica]RRD04697.1 hypothetical protein EII34_09130 [Arachnia propionica]